ncbi:hypothetical protein HDU79_010147 [Rhizoclosmatium sp. JEL0117]|nr:hypothetical protein HDU79_010147 [Rhizoclosmatium sp. JEL0117]
MPFVEFHHFANTPRWAAATTILERYSVGGRVLDEDVVKRVLETDGYEWDVSGLATYLAEPTATSTESVDGSLRSAIRGSVLTEQILPRMAALALELPSLFREPFPLLLAGRNGSLTFSQRQIACLIANAFFGTLPDQGKLFNGKRKFPHLDFRPLFQAWVYSPVTKAKLDGVFEYFSQILERSDLDTAKVTFTRRCLSENEYPEWNISDAEFCDIRAHVKGKIEDEGVGCLQADFANEIIGGGVLQQGAVQEEILFIIYPEMLASLLFCQQMMDNEAIFISGPERFARYSGYASTFKITGRFIDRTDFDSKRRRKTEFVAMDAIYFRRDRKGSQFEKEYIVRELRKAYTAFLLSHQSPLEGNPAIATGNWGCGAFNGDVELKLLIQLMAAAATRRDLRYFTFGDEDLVVNAATLIQLLKRPGITLGNYS